MANAPDEITVKVVVDPLYPIQLGPRAGITIRPEDTEWSGLPPGTYRPKFEPHDPPSNRYLLVYERE